MIKGTLVEKASGKPFGHVTVQSEAAFAAYQTDTIDIVPGHQELSPPRMAERQQALDRIAQGQQNSVEQRLAALELRLEALERRSSDAPQG